VKPETHCGAASRLKGKTPVVRQTARAFHSSLISAISNLGKCSGCRSWRPSTPKAFHLTFLAQLIKCRRRKLILVADNLRVHRANEAKVWAEVRRKQIELVLLPPHCPDLITSPSQ